MTIPAPHISTTAQASRRHVSPTRRPMPLWDRVKFLLLLGALWFLLVWSLMAGNPLIGFRDAWIERTQTARWLIALLGVELVRQVHFLVSERWAAYHRFWTKRVFGSADHFMHRQFSSWTRFRLKRAAIWLFWIAVLAVVLGQVYDVSPAQGLFKAPTAFFRALPFLVQAIVLMFVVVMQFAAIFWFLSKGGVKTYFPEDIETRFSDVWGQDHVLERVRENIIFLEKPEAIEDKGGYVPAGILLWGPSEPARR